MKKSKEDKKREWEEKQEAKKAAKSFDVLLRIAMKKGALVSVTQKN